MVTITKGVKTFDGKIPVTLLVDDVETALLNKSNFC
ncbi:Uncharacterised protein [Klebsiella pneumoniae]|nr:Uncharacterised protein [Klebsiella pneumoniae]CAC9088547.1 Uncharacterised protein [Klebsiella pneumoniae]